MAIRIQKITLKLQIRLKRQVAACYRGKEFRPTAVAIIYVRGIGSPFEYLTVTSVREPHEYFGNHGPPKGGVGIRENILKALFREIKEEVGIDRSQLVLEGYCGTAGVKSSSNKGGFPKKKYFFFLLRYTGYLNLTIQESEISGYKWILDNRIRPYLRSLKARRVTKYRALIKVYRSVTRHLKAQSCATRKEKE